MEDDKQPQALAPAEENLFALPPHEDTYKQVSEEYNTVAEKMSAPAQTKSLSEHLADEGHAPDSWQAKALLARVHGKHHSDSHLKADDFKKLLHDTLHGRI